jgi:tRNA pseudouridine32 synthase/23S rRNA pseudouridine746 synthase
VVDRREGPLGKLITLVEFRPETGRTHQIRIHAQAGLGAALLGDPIYGTGEGAARTMLHAAALTVQRDGKPPIAATAPLPADFLALGFADPAPANPSPDEESDPCPPTS